MKLFCYFKSESNEEKNLKNSVRRNLFKNFQKFNHLEKWLILNYKKNFCYVSKFQCYLKNLIGIGLKHVFLNSHFSLLILRLETMEKRSFFFSKIGNKFNYEFHTVLVPFNSLIVIPIKQLNFFNIKQIYKKIIFKTKNSRIFNFQILKWNFIIKKKIFFFYNLIFFQNQKSSTFEKKQKSINFVSYFIEGINSLFESFSFFHGISFLVTINRNFYWIKIMICYFRAVFSRIEKFKIFFLKKRLVYERVYLINLKKFEKNQKKIDHMLANIFRFDCTLSFLFFDINSEFFRILPSNANIPFISSVKLFKNHELFKKKINPNMVLLFKKEKKKNKKKRTKIVCFSKNSISKSYKKNKTNSKYNPINSNFLNSFFLLKKAKDFFNEQIGAFQISQFDKIFREGNLNIWLNPFLIQFSDLNFGSIEVVPNSITLHYLHKIEKKKIQKMSTQKKKNQEIIIIKKKRINFIESLTGYSLFSFFIQLKDRHNNNILLNSENRIIHIDFGFILGDYPGYVNLEADFFKLTKEFLFKLGGKKTEEYELFRELLTRGFFLIRKNMGKLFVISRKIIKEKRGKKKKTQKLLNFQKRLKITSKDSRIIKFSFLLVNKSIENWKTIQYDRYQYLVNKIE